jgi:hypothetical protein
LFSTIGEFGKWAESVVAYGVTTVTNAIAPLVTIFLELAVHCIIVCSEILRNNLPLHVVEK